MDSVTTQKFPIKKCTTCQRTGHLSDDCYMNKTCDHCGKLGHPSDKCYKICVCEKCGNKGHATKNCRTPFCDKCNHLGHTADKCWTRCTRCFRVGHSITECTTPKCEKCSRLGHLAAECYTSYCDNCKIYGHSTYRCRKPSVSSSTGMASVASAPNASSTTKHVIERPPRNPDQNFDRNGDGNVMNDPVVETCDKCGKRGHDTVDCWKCRNCSQYGHKVNHCPQLAHQPWCALCKQNHDMKSCKLFMRYQCQTCGETGKHLTKFCNSPYLIN